MADYRELSKRLAGIAAELIRTAPELSGIKGSGVRIAYVTSENEKTNHGRPVLGQCEKVPDRFKFAMPYDFVVTVYLANVERLTPAQMRVLMLHELMHVGVETDGNEERYFVVPHDVEDFKALIEKHGLGWSE